MKNNELKKPNRKTATTTLRLPEAKMDIIRKECKAVGIPVAEGVRQIITSWVDSSRPKKLKKEATLSAATTAPKKKVTKAKAQGAKKKTTKKKAA